MQLPATQRMELGAHMRSASEPRAKPRPSRENDFAGSCKTSMMTFPVAVTKGWAFALQYPTESVGFSGSCWTWFGLGGLTWRSDLEVFGALSDINGRCRGADPVLRCDVCCEPRGCPDASAQC